MGTILSMQLEHEQPANDPGHRGVVEPTSSQVKV